MQLFFSDFYFVVTLDKKLLLIAEKLYLFDIYPFFHLRIAIKSEINDLIFVLHNKSVQ